jgi:hypothetical protein
MLVLRRHLAVDSKVYSRQAVSVPCFVFFLFFCLLCCRLLFFFFFFFFFFFLFFYYYYYFFFFFSFFSFVLHVILCCRLLLVLVCYSSAMSCLCTVSRTLSNSLELSLELFPLSLSPCD